MLKKWSNGVILSYLWGIETQRKKNGNDSPLQILSYLWGIETRLYDKITASRRWFYLTYEELKPETVTNGAETITGFYLTYEELKPPYAGSSGDARYGILSYLWGIETHFQNIRTFGQWKDFILPMRNWNRVRLWFITHGSSGFYLTYEELKPIHGVHTKKPLSEILSYLWGIETKVNHLCLCNV